MDISSLFFFNYYEIVEGMGCRTEFLVSFHMYNLLCFTVLRYPDIDKIWTLVKDPIPWTLSWLQSPASHPSAFSS